MMRAAYSRRTPWAKEWFTSWLGQSSIAQSSSCRLVQEGIVHFWNFPSNIFTHQFATGNGKHRQWSFKPGCNEVLLLNLTLLHFFPTKVTCEKNRRQMTKLVTNVYIIPTSTSVPHMGSFSIHCFKKFREAMGSPYLQCGVLALDPCCKVVYSRQAFIATAVFEALASKSCDYE